MNLAFISKNIARYVLLSLLLAYILYAVLLPVIPAVIMGALIGIGVEYLIQKYVDNAVVKPKKNYPPMPVVPQMQGATHGTSGWENPELINHHFNDSKYEDNFVEGEGYYIGAGYNLNKLMHAVCIAGSGQGKGTCLILPNLLKTPTASWFVLDPKGENANITARWQQEAGQKVYILDPWNEQKKLGATHGIEAVGFNPLAFVKDNPDEMPEICSVLAEMIVPESGAKDSYWESRARALIKTYLLHLITARPEEEHHLGTLYRWLRLSTRDRQKLWFEMDENLECDELVKSGIGEFMGMSDETGPLPSIISNAQDNTSFLESQPLRAALSKDQFNPYSLTNGKTTVYLCLPERFMSSHARWLRLVIGVCMKACNYRPKKRVNFLLDEFAILGKMPDVQRAFAFGRGQFISCWIFVQSLTQLIDVYGDNGASTFLSNATLRQFFGILDLKTQQYVSDYLGEVTITTTTTSQSHSSGGSSGSSTGGNSSGSNWSAGTTTNKQQMARKLLTTEEVGKEANIITFIEGRKYRLVKLRYWESFFQAFKDKRFYLFPLSLEGWHNFLDTVDLGHWPVDINSIFVPRADNNVRVPN